MFSIYFQPHPALAEFVECICIMGHDFSCSDNLSPFYTYMPTHTRLLCFYLEDSVKVKKGDGEFENHGRAVIIGPQLTPVTLDLGKKHSNLLVLFKPCGLYLLLGIDLCQMLDCDFDAQLIIGKEITEITERLMEAKSCNAKNGIIQLYLLSKLNEYQPPLPIDLAMSQMIILVGKCLWICWLLNPVLVFVNWSVSHFSELVCHPNTSPKWCAFLWHTNLRKVIQKPHGQRLHTSLVIMIRCTLFGIFSILRVSIQAT